MRTFRRMLMTLLLTLSLTGCTSHATPRSPMNIALAKLHPDTLVIVRTNPLRQPNYPLINMTIRDAARVNRMYHDLISLPAPPQGPIHCPNDNGVTYQVTFKEGSEIVLTGTVRHTGCRMVSLSKGSPKNRWSMGAKGSDFWSTLSKSLGIDESKL